MFTLNTKSRKFYDIKTYREAINEALLQEMKKDENVVVIGEDVAGGAGTNGEQDAWGGVLGVTKGLNILEEKE